MYQALYRKWRPRTFDDVVGQSHITDTLKQQVAGGGCPTPICSLGPGDGQDHLRQDPVPGGELPEPGERQPLQSVPGLPGH